MTTLLIYPLVLLSLVLTSCSDRTSYPRHETLYIGGHEWSAPHNFNPLNSWPVTWPATSNSNLLFECLFGYNILTGELEPLLGKEWALSDSVLSVALHETARWHDGVPVTAEDVLYTFDLHRRYWTHHHSIWGYIEFIDINHESGDIIIKLSDDNYNPLVLKDVIATVYILPRHIYEPLERRSIRTVERNRRQRYEELATEEERQAFRNAVFAEMRAFRNLRRPVGSGPYTVRDAQPGRIVLERVDDYWGNRAMYGGRKPAPRFIIHPIYESNGVYNLALTRGDIDLSATFCPMIGEKRVHGVGTFYDTVPYYVPGSIPSLLINHQPDVVRSRTGELRDGWTKDVLKDSLFRRAAAHSIDREIVRKIAIQNYAPPLQCGYIINDDIEGLFFNADDVETYGTPYDPTKALRILESAGYRWSGKDSLLITPEGDTVAELTIVSPAGWTDWEAAVKISVQGMRAVGIPVKERFIDESLYWETLALGNFDFIVKTPQADQLPSLPWSRFERVMTNAMPIGEWASSNEGRYENRRADSLLQLIPRLGFLEQREAYRELNRIFMKDVPVIPLMYRPSVFYQFNTSVWRGFPTFNDIQRGGPAYSPQNLNIGAAVKGLWELELNDSAR